MDEVSENQFPDIEARLQHVVKPWVPLGDTGEAFVCELRKELSPQHVLHGVSIVAVARHTGCEDVLFASGDPSKPIAVVHLT